MKKMISIIVSIIALTVMAPGHADEVVVQEVTTGSKFEFLNQMVTDAQDKLGTVVSVLTTPFVDFKFTAKDQDCLARNIFYEAANEPEEGKVAVAMVTVNRVKDTRFGKTVCDVVNQRTVFVRTIEKTEEIIQRGWFGRPEAVTKKSINIAQVPICQFSWVCAFVRKPKVEDQRWQESKRIAEAVLNNEYEEYRIKYSTAMYFHSTGIKPVWASHKVYVSRIGGHIFYADRI